MLKKICLPVQNLSLSLLNLGEGVCLVPAITEDKVAQTNNNQQIEHVRATAILKDVHLHFSDLKSFSHAPHYSLLVLRVYGICKNWLIV